MALLALGHLRQVIRLLGGGTEPLSRLRVDRGDRLAIALNVAHEGTVVLFEFVHLLLNCVDQFDLLVAAL